jgi:hypothetical protein
MTFGNKALDSRLFGGPELDEWVFQGGDDIDSDVLFAFGTPHHIFEFASAIHRLFLTLRLRQVIISGHGGEAEALAAAAYRQGVPPDVFSLERTASNTRENVASSEAMLRSACPGGQLHVLAKRYALPRCLLTLQAVFPGWKFRLHGVDWLALRPETWRSHLPFRRKVALEMAKIAEYAARGDIGMPPHPWTLDKLKIASAALARTETAAGSASSQEGDAGPSPDVQVSVSGAEHLGDMPW